jgi:uncharacterized protein
MKVSRYLQGQPCWAELATHNWRAAKTFYSELLGWGIADMAIPGGAFSMFNLGGDELGAMYQMPDAMQKDMPSHWSVYFAVEDVEATIAKVQAAGGFLIMGPHDVGDAGRMAQLTDPEGSRFAVWQARQHIGAKRTQEIGTLCWVELACRDAGKERGFYQDVFGWQTRLAAMPEVDYTEWLVADEAFGGMLEMTEAWGDAPSHWMLYFTVKDCDEVTDRALSLGGEVCMPPTNIPDVGRFATLKDPQGSLFSVIALTPG